MSFKITQEHKNNIIYDICYNLSTYVGSKLNQTLEQRVEKYKGSISLNPSHQNIITAKASNKIWTTFLESLSYPEIKNIHLNDKGSTQSDDRSSFDVVFETHKVYFIFSDSFYSKTDVVENFMSDIMGDDYVKQCNKISKKVIGGIAAGKKKSDIIADKSFVGEYFNLILSTLEGLAENPESVKAVFENLHNSADDRIIINVKAKGNFSIYNFNGELKEPESFALTSYEDTNEILIEFDNCVSIVLKVSYSDLDMKISKLTCHVTTRPDPSYLNNFEIGKGNIYLINR